MKVKKMTRCNKNMFTLSASNICILMYNPQVRILPVAVRIESAAALPVNSGKISVCNYLQKCTKNN